MKTKATISVVTLFFLLISAGFILKPLKTSKASFSETYLPVWEKAIQTTLEVAEAMPEEKYNYKPTEVSKSFGQQIVHIGYASNYLADVFINGEQAEYKEPDASKMTKSEIVQFTKKHLDNVSQIIGSMSDEAWQEPTKSPGGNQIVKNQAILFVQDHLTNHRAKANLYIRMNDMEPPSYFYY